MARVELPGYEIVGIRAANAGPLTLTGTNSWIVGEDPAWLVDPGPALDDHIESLLTELEQRGGLAGVALTHDHPDHAEALAAVRSRYPAALLAAVGGAPDVRLSDGSPFGPFIAIHTRGHSPDHVAFVTGDVAFTGDAVLGEGSVFISPDPGAMTAYLEALVRLRRRELALLCPGHGQVVRDPAAKLDHYIAHRLEREHRLLAALDAGRRSTDELLEEVWDDVPSSLRPAAAMTLAAHLDKLAGEDRLPAGVERPRHPG